MIYFKETSIILKNHPECEKNVAWIGDSKFNLNVLYNTIPGIKLILKLFQS